MLFKQNGVGGIRSGFKRLTFLCVPGGIEVMEGHIIVFCLRAVIALMCIIKDGLFAADSAADHNQILKSIIL